jgi:MFS-type transporter involved in bile tolerance (Atg22 family)
MALINSCGALGGFAGIWLVGVLQARTGDSRAGFFYLSISLMLAGAMIYRLRPSRPAIKPI